MGADMKNNLFGDADPIGKTIKIEGRPFTVIGVAKAKGSVFGQSQDGFVDIPDRNVFPDLWFAAGHPLCRPRRSIRTCWSKPRTRSACCFARAATERPNQDDTFSILSSDSLVGAWDQLTGAIAATAVAVVSVFMVVGGVVIMNIMLAVVTERTHEIGIRKSVGARRQDILNQFLVESSMLAGIGGLIGVLLAWVVALLVRSFTPVPMAVPISAVAHRRGALRRCRAVLRNLSGAARFQAGSRSRP